MKKTLSFLLFLLSFVVASNASALNLGGSNTTGMSRVLTSSSSFLNMTTATTTQIVALSTGLQIKVYGVAISATVDGAQTVKFVYGTGINCVTGTTDLTPPFAPSTATATTHQYTLPVALMPWFIVPASNALCVVTSAAINNTGTLVVYIQE